MPIAEVAGKLAKVDWPTRRAYERVTFEPAGVDHASPGSSFTGSGVVSLGGKIFGGDVPLHFGVLLRRHDQRLVQDAQRLGRRRAHPGGRPGDLRAPAGPLAVRPGAVREQSITLAFDQEVGRVYDEWDALGRKVADGTADAPLPPVRPRGRDRRGPAAWSRPRPLPFRTLASVADITAGDEAQILRILQDAAMTPRYPVASLDEVPAAPGSAAQAWVAGYMEPPTGPRSAWSAGPGPAGRAERGGTRRAQAFDRTDGR